MRITDFVPFFIMLKDEKKKNMGLMFKPKVTNIAYVFDYGVREMKRPIHMLFVFQKLDIVWLNNKNVVIDYKSKVLPFLPFVGHKGFASKFIEFPGGSVKNIKVGEVLELK